MPERPTDIDAGTNAREVDADSPWLGLLSFTEKTQRFFFGRDAEIREIFLRVRDHPLTVLYGQSGYGKTSLLNAGLIPKLKADGFRPVVLQLRYEKTDRSLLDQVRFALALACVDENDLDVPYELWDQAPLLLPGYDLKLLHKALALATRWANATLWECFHVPELRTAHLHAAPPVIILDQFEEAFTLGAMQRSRAEIEALATELADLVENRPPASVQKRLADDLDFASEVDFRPSPLRFIITLREDFLSHLETWKDAMPSLMRNRMALHRLRGPQAREAVVRPGRLDGRNLISDEVGEQIVRVIARQLPNTPLQEIEAVPPLLSLLCDELNRARRSNPTITAELVAQRHQNILQDFYTRCFDGFPPEVRRFVEDKLVTGVGGHRNQVSREDAEAELTHAGVAAPGTVIDILLARRLLSVEERSGTQRIEITHDVLAPLVVESRDKRHEREKDQELYEKHLAARKVREMRRLRRLLATTSIAALLAIVGMGYAWKLRNEARFQSEAATKARDFAEYRRKQAAVFQEQLRRARLSDLATAKNLFSEGKWRAAVAYLGRALSYDPENPENRLASSWLWSEIVYGEGDRDRLPRHLLPHEGEVNSAVFSPDGRRIVTACGDLGKPGYAQQWEASTGKPVGEPLRHSDEVLSAVFSPDGQRIVTACGISGSIGGPGYAQQWDAVTGRAIGEPLLHQSQVRIATYSPDGQRILTVSDDAARLWQVTDGKPLGEPMRHKSMITSAVFSPDGSRVLTAGVDKTARVWDGTTGTSFGEPMPHKKIVNSAVFSPDGAHILTASDDTTAQLWETATRKPLGYAIPHDMDVRSAMFSPDGTRVITASYTAARLWEATSGNPIGEPLTDGSSTVNHALFSDDGTRVLTVGGGARVWDASNGNPLSEPLRHDMVVVSSAVFSPDGMCVLTVAKNDKIARLWNTALHSSSGEPMRHDTRVNSATYSPDGQRIVTVCGFAQMWDVVSGQRVGLPMHHERDVHAAVFSHDGRRIVTASYDQTAALWDAGTGNRMGEPLRHKGLVKSAVFSSDDARVLTASGLGGPSGFGEALLWELATGKVSGEPMRHESLVNSAVFSRDGLLIVTASVDGTAQVWEAGSGKPVGQPLPHGMLQVNSAVFSLDGKRVLTASNDETAQIWNIAAATLVGAPMRHTRAVLAASFSGDDQLIVTAAADDTAQLWEASGERLGPPLRHDGWVNSAVFSPDGTHILTGSADNTARLWEVNPPTSRPPRWLDRFTLVLSGLRFDAKEQLVPVSEQERVNAREKLQGELPASTDSRSVPAAGWERLAQWALAPVTDRQVTPGSALSIATLADRELASGQEAGVRHALALAPNHPLVHLALAAFEADPVRAAFLRQYDLHRLPSDPSLCRHAAEMLRKQNQPDLADKVEAKATR